MRRLIASLLLLAVSLIAGAPYGNRNAVKHGNYSSRGTRGRSGAIYASKTHAGGKSQTRIATRSRTNPNVRVMSRRAR